MAYSPKLPEGITLPPGHSIDTSAARYKELEALATRQKWSQDAFSGVLGLEAKRVAEAHASASAPCCTGPGSPRGPGELGQAADEPAVPLRAAKLQAQPLMAEVYHRNFGGR